MTQTTGLDDDVFSEPRYTAAWKRRNAEDRAALSAALDQPPIRAAWHLAVDGIRSRAANGPLTPQPDATIEGAIDGLCRLVKEFAPQLAKRHGIYLRPLLAEVLLPAAAGLPVEVTGRRIEHLSPDSPITLHGDQFLGGAMKATNAQLLEVTAYARSLRPAKTLGRPQRAPAAASPSTKGTGRPRIDETIAAEASHLAQAGRSWREIARALSLGPVYGNKLNATRQKVGRYVERGRMITKTRTKKGIKN